jgi:hypothetical protein
MIISRVSRLCNKDLFRLGRLSLGRDIIKSRQKQKINMAISGRLLVDTYAHAKDMIKSVDY